MKKEIHPSRHGIKVECACGFAFETSSTRKGDLRLEICARCHPFFTGQQKIIESAKQVDSFRRRYGSAKQTAS
ncbi:MAG: 50S ribosomal protein L31 [Gammaproteobacteria bacterium]|nr:50S ribosomal protein L31 [Pseudomonadota bacterium]MCH9662294.1 50S ribosomal protein L31 [Gammaproteobacteria bacterium]